MTKLNSACAATPGTAFCIYEALRNVVHLTIHLNKSLKNTPMLCTHNDRWGCIKHRHGTRIIGEKCPLAAKLVAADRNTCWYT